TASPNAVTAGQTVTLRATVAAVPGRPLPTGAVTFSDGYSLYATRSLDGSGAASYSAVRPYSATYTLTASYSGDANYVASTRTLSEKVLAPSTVQLSSTASPADPGKQVTITAVVPGASTGSV